jgi:hypothetical protein
VRTDSPRLVRNLVALATTGLLLTACSAEDLTERVVEEAAEQAGAGSDVDINTDDGSVSIETDEGSFNIGSQDLPEELADELPIPDGLEVTGSLVQTVDEVQNIGIQATYDGSFDDVSEFYASELEANGWTVTNDSATDGPGLRTRSFQIEGYGYTGLVGITEAGEEGSEDGFLGVSINLQEDDGSA